MIDFQTIAAIIFLIFLSIFIFLKRKEMHTQKILYPLLYFSMYRTKVGLDFMDSFAKKFNKTLKYFGYAGIIVGFLGMILLSFSLVQNLYNLLTTPEAAPGVGLVLPFKVRGAFFVPFFYWIISLFVIALVHEYAHGVIARTHNLKVKSSGFAFLGILIPIIPAAFVEPDEKELKKMPHKQQLSVFAAGPFSNIILAFVLLLIFNILLVPVYATLNERDGVLITDFTEDSAAQEAGVAEGEIVREIDDSEIKTITNLSDAMKNYNPGDKINFITDKRDYRLILGSNPDNNTMPYMGIFLEQNTKIKKDYKNFRTLNSILLWFTGDLYKQSLNLKTGLIGWLILLNLGIGLFNLVPIGPIDGGRMLQLALHKVFKKEKGDKVWRHISMIFLFLVIVNLAFSFIR